MQFPLDTELSFHASADLSHGPVLSLVLVSLLNNKERIELTWKTVPSGEASPAFDQQHLASGTARTLCHCDMYERDTGIQLVGLGREQVGILNFLASHSFKTLLSKIEISQC